MRAAAVDRDLVLLLECTPHRAKARLGCRRASRTGGAPRSRCGHRCRSAPRRGSRPSGPWPEISASDTSSPTSRGGSRRAASSACSPVATARERKPARSTTAWPPSTRESYPARAYHESRSVHADPPIDDLPGADLVLEGIQDLRSGRDTAAAALVRMAAPRLRAVGLDVPQAEYGSGRPGHRLYELLAGADPATAHGRYNALVERVVSFARAAERARAG